MADVGSGPGSPLLLTTILYCLLRTKVHLSYTGARKDFSEEAFFKLDLRSELARWESPGKGKGVVPLWNYENPWAEAGRAGHRVQFGRTEPLGLESCESVSYKP